MLTDSDGDMVYISGNDNDNMLINCAAWMQI